MEEKEEICLIHKGRIEGISYICPRCQGKYCLKCATALAGDGVSCWVCDQPINIPGTSKKPVTSVKVGDLLNKSDLTEHLLNQGDVNLTAISKEFIQRIDQFNWSREEKEQFLKEMLSLTPKEREAFLNEMVEEASNTETFENND